MNTVDLITSPTRASEALAAQAARATPAAGKRSWLSLIGWIAVLAVLGGAWHGADMRPLDLLSD
ncbi:MAG: phosphonate ABC transporter, permease protein PhnE, partial [Paraburkholderia nemoris]